MRFYNTHGRVGLRSFLLYEGTSII
jgi:hypothetical protein